jgi:putative phosphoribosyl transferase
MPFTDRHDAGNRLAERLAGADLDRPVILALPRGGVPVAAPVAASLHVDVHPFVARKIGAPGHKEFGIGAIAEGSDDVVVSEAATRLGLSDQQMLDLAQQERVELGRRVATYRGGRDLPPIEGRDVVLIDDGLATGVTAEAALKALRKQRPRRLILAVPVCATDSAQRLQEIADEVICLEPRDDLQAIGLWYENFDATSDEEVLALVGHSEKTTTDDEPPEERPVDMALVGGGELHGDLTVPHGATGVVLFAHGSGSSRKSPRNRAVATALQRRGLATLLIDLLTASEERVDMEQQTLRFDIDLLADRLRTATFWLSGDESTKALGLGYFGASTGAAAALVAATDAQCPVRAVVSRGGRPDLAGPALAEVSAPTLLIVGGRDETVLDLNRQALTELRGEASLEVVEGATHLFEEARALDRVAELAADWFTAHLGH